ncbi:putative selenoprotein [Rahnella sp. Lac-M11]|uniref:Putative selenoprotein n=1 Tax=Rahnella contaminans TaxID=2703882 RepID=A0A6M2B2E1_9GAMM|nr:CstA-like transporter-associated (seleno)protein [Rahnella contaminans]NGX86554.1 putative selenoprotein [Rahnella contaminans]
MSESRSLFKTPRLTAFHIIRCRPLFIVEPKPHNIAGWLRLAVKRTAQSFRLMVGVQDYGNYVAHMQVRHPEIAPMTEREFHRRCLEARFPSESGKMGKCPC